MSMFFFFEDFTATRYYNQVHVLANNEIVMSFIKMTVLNIFNEDFTEGRQKYKKLAIIENSIAYFLKKDNSAYLDPSDICLT